LVVFFFSKIIKKTLGVSDYLCLDWNGAIMPELEVIRTLGDLFTVTDDPENKISTMEFRCVSFEVNKEVEMKIYPKWQSGYIPDILQVLVTYKGKEFSFHLGRGMWEIALANFLDVHDGHDTIVLQDVLLDINAYGTISESSVQTLQRRVLNQLDQRRKNKLALLESGDKQEKDNKRSKSAS
jgi:hypothetical protein